MKTAVVLICLLGCLVAHGSALSINIGPISIDIDVLKLNKLCGINVEIFTSTGLLNIQISDECKVKLLLDKLQSLVNKLEGDLKEELQKIIEDLKDALKNAPDKVCDVISRLVQILNDASKKLPEAVRKILEEIVKLSKCSGTDDGSKSPIDLNGLVDLIGKLCPDLDIQAILDIVKNLGDNPSEALKKEALKKIGGLLPVECLKKLAGSILEELSKAGGDVGKAANDAIEKLENPTKAVIKSVIEDLQELLKGPISDAQKAVIQLLISLLEGLSEKVE